MYLKLESRAKEMQPLPCDTGIDLPFNLDNTAPPHSHTSPTHTSLSFTKDTTKFEGSRVQVMRTITSTSTLSPLIFSQTH